MKSNTRTLERLKTIATPTDDNPQRLLWGLLWTWGSPHGGAGNFPNWEGVVTYSYQSSVKSKLKQRTEPWTEFLKRLATPVRIDQTSADLARLSDDEVKALKEGECFIGGTFSSDTRKNESLTARTFISLDFDNNTSFRPSFRFFRYTTFSTWRGEPRFRYIIPTTRAMTAEEYPKVVDFILKGRTDADACSRKVSQAMYFPKASKDTPFFVDWGYDHFTLDVDKVLAEAESTAEEVIPFDVLDDDKRLADFTKKLEPKEMKVLRDAVLYNEYFSVFDVLEQFTHVYQPTNKRDRYLFVGSTSPAGGVVYDNGKRFFTNHTSDTTLCTGHCYNAYDLMRIWTFGDDRQSYTEMRKYMLSLPELEGKMNFIPVVEWENDLKTTNKGTLANTLPNKIMIVLNSAHFECLWYDTFSSKLVVRGKAPWKRPETATEYWEDWDDTEIKVYLSSEYGLTVTDNEVSDILNAVKRERNFNAIRDYLEQQEWDGTPRLEKFFIDTLNVEDTPLDRGITKKCIVAMIYRALCGGTPFKFDYLTVLQGEQGIGKSTVLDYLGLGKWHSENIYLKKEGADLYSQLDGVWVAELSELGYLKKADANNAKQFISSGKDVYRAKYAKHDTTKVRHCVLFSTTNELEFLKDPTGLRRFWVLKSKQPKGTVAPLLLRMINDEAFRGEYIGQVFAEAYKAYKDGYDVEPNAEMKVALAMRAEVFEDRDPLEYDAEAYLSLDVPLQFDSWDKTKRAWYIQNAKAGNEMEGGFRRTEVSAEEFLFEWFGISDLSKIDLRRYRTALGKVPGYAYTGKRVTRPGYGQRLVAVLVAEKKFD